MTTTILTRAAVGEVSQLHDRTQVTLPPSFWDEWLDAGQDGDQTLVDAAVAAATPVAEALEFHQVGPLKGTGQSWWCRSIHEALAIGSSSQWVV
ncbi:SOS response-associated peptidase family protein [Arthrobacter alpinus]|nr:SOS response-associated peptidase family protein [Arthrobacter alpinus]